MTKNRVNWLTVPDNYALNAACLRMAEAFDNHPYLVGSVLQRVDYHDVDVRMMLDDEQFKRMFPTMPILLLSNAMYSHKLAHDTGLPIDFQFQDTTKANEEFDGYRHSLGMPSYREATQ